MSKSCFRSRHSDECPCNGCTERYLACSDTCKRYKDWKAEGKRIEDNRKAYLANVDLGFFKNGRRKHGST